MTSITNVNAGTLAPGQTNITVTVSAPPGWIYLQFPDPSAGTMTIASVTRSDGVNLLVGPNVWQTPERVHMLPPQPQNLVHLFDYNSTGSYTITYGPMVTAPPVTTLTRSWCSLLITRRSTRSDLLLLRTRFRKLRTARGRTPRPDRASAAAG